MIVESLRPQVEAIVDRMLNSLHRSSEADLLREIAYPLPVRVIAERLGIPNARQEDLLEASDAIAVFMGNPNRTVEQVRAA
jgi:cytochrome P450